MTTAFRPNTSISATVQTVVDAINGAIRGGKYSADERLPSERTLATELGVARNTVREALEILEGRGLIRRRAGSGSFVNPSTQGTTQSDVADATSPLALQVMRGILEPEMVRLAVINMAPQQIEGLGQTLSALESVRTDVEQFTQLEEEFYRKIAKGTGNPLLEASYELVLDAAKQRFRTAHLRRHLTPGRIENHQKRYNSLFNAIAARNIETAVEFIKLHLIEEQSIMLQQS